MRIIFFTIVAVCLATVMATGELISLVHITRHGDRSPLRAYGNPGKSAQWNCSMDYNYYTTDGHEDYDRVYSKFWTPNEQVIKGNCYMGQLTKRGARQHYDLGRQLREKYRTFLPEKCVEPTCHVRATFIERTQISARFNILGMFPAGDEEDIVDIHVVDEKADYMYGNMNPTVCPAIVNYVDKFRNSDEYKTEIAKINQHKAWFRENFPGHNVGDWGLVYDWFHCRHSNNIADPVELPDGFLEKLKTFTIFNYYNFANHTLKLYIGNHAKEVVSLLRNITNGNLERKYTFYSGHDVTIIPWMIMLEMPRNFPDYASHFEIELFRNDDGYYIRVYYNDDVVQLKDSDDNGFIRFEKFENMLKPYFPENWRDDCQSMVF
ncbi:hypothetical protein PCE1_003474 [Barthelona sp. PCE]